ncbi:unnamed protein product [Blepharisma stoltei]|uniref:B box-type domain-containing protein n=1 Tax=Blepharisma stoltei TaxID=1481888 RepID=A0AAU9JW25_9CILI|nr:unnamed protein product [Blepharisma stoltei]
MSSSRSTIRGSDVLVKSEELDVGYCKEHGRSNEAFCEECRVVICPTCIMFGSHKGHSVQSPNLASRFIRDKIDKTTKSGKLNPEYTDRFLADIRDAKHKAMTLEETVIQKIDEDFRKLKTALKKRREELKESVFDHFETEIEKIAEQERKWEEKESLSKMLLENSSNPDDEALVKNSLTVLNAIDSLNEDVEFKTVKLITSIDLSFNSAAQGVSLGFSQLIHGLEEIGKFGDNKQLQFRA